MRLASLIATVIIIALGGAAVAGAQSPQCDAGNTLLADGHAADAKQRFNKALDDGGSSSQCGITGLKDVAAAEKTAEAEAAEVTFGEAVEAPLDFVTQNYGWIIVVLGVWAVMLAGAWWRDEGGVRVHAPASSEDLAKRVAAAARAAGGESTPPAKIVTASDEAADTTAADLAKVFRLPGTVPLGDLLKRPPFSAWLSTRLDVSGAIAGGWAVIDLTLRGRLFLFKCSDRIAVDLGDVPDAEKTDVLALIGGAWLNAAMHEDGAPVAGRDPEGLKAHALFWAGANRQALGKTQIARACYAAMPDADPHRAPHAWVGSRLNEMMALKTERRWLEAAQIANQVGDFPNDMITGDERLPFKKDQLAELLLRQRYMTAILRVDLYYAKPHADRSAPRRAQLEEAAKVAVEHLNELVGERPGERRDLQQLRAAGRMVVLCYRIAVGEGGMLETVYQQLGLGDFNDAKRPTVSAAGYFDAACAVSLLLAHSKDDEQPPDRYVREGLSLLETAVAATLEGRRARVRELARTDPMLEHLEQADPTRFANALGESPPTEPRSTDQPPKEEQPPPAAGNATSNVVASVTGS